METRHLAHPSKLYAVLLSAALLTAACGRGPRVTAADAGAADPPSLRGDCGPVKLALMQDKSRSTNWTRTPQLVEQDLHLLLGLLNRCGGELGFGLIRDQSNRPLIRVRIAPPPTPPQAPERKRNPFLNQQARQAHVERVEAYHHRHATWKQQTELATRQFMDQVLPILRAQADAPRTDVWNALRRADLFLAEEDTNWGRSTSRWLLLVSDCEDNVQAPRSEIRSGARVVIVNGAARVGVLGFLDPLRFESPRAAFEHVVAVETETRRT